MAVPGQAPAGAAEPVQAAQAAAVAPVAADAAESAAAATAAPLVASAAEAVSDAPSAQPSQSPAAALAEVPLRRGLPRTPGGDPWPPAGSALVAAAAENVAAAPAEVAASVPAAAAAPLHTEAVAPAAPAANVSSAAAVQSAASASATATVSEEVTLRQGLPRVSGGDPWPPAATVTVQRAVASPAAGAAELADAVAAPVQPVASTAAQAPAPAASVAPVVTPAAASVAAAQAAATPAAAAPAEATPAPATPAAAAPSAKTKPAASATAPVRTREPIVIGNRTLGQWTKLAVLWGGGAIVAAAIIVLAARGLTTLPGVPEFLKRYPGEYHLPEFTDPGFPAWARWSHFLNFFLMVLIIRSGLLVRRQQKPDAFFTPKKGGTKVSIYLWLHTSLDIIWLANGVVFVVLLFVSGHWARIVPTSWEVFPNAISAMIQYLTLEWPVENGWVNYNSLQQLMYFTVVFIAAPLAAITGVRMSEWWPKNAEKLNKLYPAPVARAIHFPVMLFFVLFILIHVFLVFATGALRNLNHMFAGTDVINWVGFAWFAGGLLLTVAVTWAARPLILAPIAGAFGRVSER